MNHQPFDTWLLSEEPLSPEQTQALEAHLQDCETCQRLSDGWSQVQLVFKQVPLMKPYPGFTARWHARLAVQQILKEQKRERKQAWWFVTISAGIALLLFVLLMTQMLMVFETPTQVFLSWIYAFVTFFSVTRAVQEVILILMRLGYAVVPPIWWMIVALAISALSLVWFASIRKIWLPRRITL